MSYYSSPEEMYTIKSSKYKKEGDRYWAKARVEKAVITIKKQEIVTQKQNGMQREQKK